MCEKAVRKFAWSQGKIGILFPKNTSGTGIQLFCAEMGMMLQSGMTVYAGVASRAVQEQSAYRLTDKKAKRLRTHFERLYQEMAAGLFHQRSDAAYRRFSV